MLAVVKKTKMNNLKKKSKVAINESFKTAVAALCMDEIQSYHNFFFPRSMDEAPSLQHEARFDTQRPEEWELLRSCAGGKSSPINEKSTPFFLFPLIL
jgi:hypothetical protein